MTKENKRLRLMLALSHTHYNNFNNYMYYDDGELSCNECGCDFKHDSVDLLQSKITAYNVKTYYGSGFSTT